LLPDTIFSQVEHRGKLLSSDFEYVPVDCVTIEHAYRGYRRFSKVLASYACLVDLDFDIAISERSLGLQMPEDVRD
jgi:hypothetical protein